MKPRDEVTVDKLEGTYIVERVEGTAPHGRLALRQKGNLARITRPFAACHPVGSSEPEEPVTEPDPLSLEPPEPTPPTRKKKKASKKRAKKTT